MKNVGHSIGGWRLAAFAVVVFGLGLCWGDRTRSASASSGAAPAPLLICSSCYFGDLPPESHVILLDTQSREMWAYSAKAMTGQAKPVSMGILRLGEPVRKRAP